MEKTPEQPLPKIGKLDEDHYVLPSGLVTTPEDWGLDSGFELEVTDSAFETAFEADPDRVTADLVQQQDTSHGTIVLSHEKAKEVIRQAIEENRASGSEQPLTELVAQIALRAKADAGSARQKNEQRYAAWSARVAPTLHTLNPDGSVASPATLTKAAGLALAMFVFVWLLTTWKLALVCAWIVVALYLLAPLWRPKAATAWVEVKKYLEPADESPRE